MLILVTGSDINQEDWDEVLDEIKVTVQMKLKRLGASSVTISPNSLVLSTAINWFLSQRVMPKNMPMIWIR